MKAILVTNGIPSSPGEYNISLAVSDEPRLNIWLPRADSPISLAISDDPEKDKRKGNEPVWKCEGEADCLTLIPSIDVHGVWHGFLTAGDLIEVVDNPAPAPVAAPRRTLAPDPALFHRPPVDAHATLSQWSGTNPAPKI